MVRSSIIARSICARVRLRAPVRSAPLRMVPSRLASRKFAPRKITFVQSAPLRLAASKFALLRSVRRMKTPLRSILKASRLSVLAARVHARFPVAVANSRTISPTSAGASRIPVIYTFFLQIDSQQLHDEGNRVNDVSRNGAARFPLPPLRGRVREGVFPPKIYPSPTAPSPALPRKAGERAGCALRRRSPDCHAILAPHKGLLFTRNYVNYTQLGETGNHSPTIHSAVNPAHRSIRQAPRTPPDNRPG